MQFPMAPLSSYVFRRCCYWTMMMAYALTLICLAKIIAERNMGLAHFGQTLVGAMNFLTLSVCAVLANLSIQPEINEESNFKLEITIAFKNRYLTVIIFLISNALGMAYAITQIIYQLLKHYGVTESESGWIGFSMYTRGTIGGMLNFSFGTKD